MHIIDHLASSQNCGGKYQILVLLWMPSDTNHVARLILI